MIKIKYNNSSQMISCEFRVIDENVCYIIGSNVENTSGFKTYDEEDHELGDWSQYTTVYRVLEDGIQYSNDGSVYVVPVEDISIKVEFDEDVAQIPTSVNVTLLSAFEVEKVVNVYAKNNWELVVKDLSIEEFWYVMKSENIEGCYWSIKNNVITYHRIYPSKEDKLEAQVLYTAMMTDTLIPEE